MFGCFVNERPSLINQSGFITICGGDEIRKLAETLENNGVDLYSAEAIVKNAVIEKYGDSYYSRNGEAIHIIVEEVYNDMERLSNPLPEYGCISWY